MSKSKELPIHLDRGQRPRQRTKVGLKPGFGFDTATHAWRCRVQRSKHGSGVKQMGLRISILLNIHHSTRTGHTTSLSLSFLIY